VQAASSAPALTCPCGILSNHGIDFLVRREFARISGVGEKKLREFGNIFLGEIAAHLQTNARQIFADDSFTAPAAPPPSRDSPGDSAREPLRSASRTAARPSH